jgi:hypothetical protein
MRLLLVVGVLQATLLGVEVLVAAKYVSLEFRF